MDEDHKNFIKEFHGEEKNFKISKQYELYSWGKSEHLGYLLKGEEQKKPAKVYFSEDENDLESIRDVKVADTFSLALSEDG